MRAARGRMLPSACAGLLLCSPMLPSACAGLLLCSPAPLYVLRPDCKEVISVHVLGRRPKEAMMGNVAVRSARRSRTDPSFSSVIEQGVARGEVRDVAIPHTLQMIIGMVVFHFASGEFGDELLGRPPRSPGPRT